MAVYGFYDLQAVYQDRVTEVGVSVVNEAIDATVAEHNRQINALLSLFVTRTTDFKTRFKTPVVARLQPLDENGRARPIQTAGYYDVAFPLHMAGSAWGANYVSRTKMTVEEAANATSTLINADMRWVRDHILAALYTNASWTYTDEAHGSLTIQGLANSDSVEYLIQTGADAGATDTHYAAQANAIGDANDPFDDIHDDLMEHPENAGSDIISFIPTNLKAAVEALTAFKAVADPNIRESANTAELVGSLGATIPGEVFGYHTAKVWLVEWKSLPNDYIVSLATNGPRPLAMREEMEAQLQGFNRVAERNDHPFYESQWLRIAGFGGWNRVGARVDRIGNASYAIPTNYTSPMA